MLISQAIGAGGQEEAMRYAVGGLVLAGIFGAITMVVGLYISGWLPLMAARRSIRNSRHGLHASTYYSAHRSFFLLRRLARSIYGHKGMHAPMVASVIANIANIALDYLFIFGGSRSRRRRRLSSSRRPWH
ncbi:MAG: MATE family efflux transporter [Myxococcota bacterium]